MSSIFNPWRNVFIVSICFRILATIQNSYIHPDEHFQSLNIIATEFEDIKNDIPWEFTSNQPARSLSILYAVYYPIMSLCFKLGFSPLSTVYICRIFLCVISWIATDLSMMSIGYISARKTLISMVLCYTSYITIVYQSHTFSNSLETIILVSCLRIITSELKQLKSSQETKGLKNLLFLAFLIVLGIFNRVTFVAFIGAPVFYYLYHLVVYKRWLRIVGFAIFGCLATAGFVCSETKLYGHFVIPPWNNLVYNSQYENLQQHGIHPLYSHVLINLPQMLGPLYLIMLMNIKDYVRFVYIKYFVGVKRVHNEQYLEIQEKELLYLCFCSGVLILSLIPHQELRFLIPLQPIVLKIIDFENLNERFTNSNPQKQTEKSGTKKAKEFVIITPRAANLVKNVLICWYVFNACLGTLMGVFHQGGILTVLDHQNEEIRTGDFLKTKIWWRTYSPPAWMLSEFNGTIVKHSLNDETDLESVALNREENELSVIDVMGMDLDKLEIVIDKVWKTDSEIEFVMPCGSYKDFSNYFGANSTKRIWYDWYHVDMDHLSTTMGIGVYSMSKPND